MALKSAPYRSRYTRAYNEASKALNTLIGKLDHVKLAISNHSGKEEDHTDLLDAIREAKSAHQSLKVAGQLYQQRIENIPTEEDKETAQAEYDDYMSSSASAFPMHPDDFEVKVSGIQVKAELTANDLASQLLRLKKFDVSASPPPTTAPPSPTTHQPTSLDHYPGHPQGKASQ